VTVHWGFWVIAGIGLIFNALGVVNLVSQMSAETVAAMPEGYRVVIENRPVWATLAFATAVIGGVLGCVLLLVKRASAVYVFIAALCGVVVTMIQFHGTAGMGPPGALVGGLSQLLVIGFFVWYSNRARDRRWIS
jgi:hypothetical protein